MKDQKASRFKLAILRWLLRSKAIYDICCALRGPDQLNHDNPNFSQFGELKIATTAVVRAKLGITNRRKGMEQLAITTYDGYYDAENRVSRRPEGSEHFLGHQKDAFVALGLKWSNPNNDIKP